MKVAVLGAGGFLGKIISNYLETKGIEVLKITRHDLDLVSYANVDSWLKTVNPYAVVNCATAGGKQRMGDQSLDDVQNNLNIFLNFFNNDKHFTKFINVGSGAEFNYTTNIDNAKEEDILTIVPKDGYGYSKNVIARLCLQNSKFYTLRLFGCFDKSEPDFRLFKKVTSGQVSSIADRQFDYFSALDYCRVVEHYLNNEVEYKDINCVYENKLYLSEILNNFGSVTVTEKNQNNYTGNGSKLAKLKLSLDGLDKSIKEYKAV